MNPYTYIFNNPLSGIDPSGYCSISDTQQQCADSLEVGESVNITDGDKVVGTATKGENGQLAISNGTGKTGEKFNKTALKGGNAATNNSVDSFSSRGPNTSSNPNVTNISSDIGAPEGIFKGVVVPAAKNLGKDTLQGFIDLNQGFNDGLAAGFAIIGAGGEIINDHQGELNTLASLGPIGVEAEATLLIFGKILSNGTKVANIIKSLSKGGFSVASGAGGASLPMQQVRTIQHGEKVSDIVNELKALTFMTGNEHAVVTLANNNRALVSGGPGGISFEAGWVKRIFGHTHPTNAPPSAADAQALSQLGQSKQYVLHGGQISVVRPKK